MIIGGVEPLLLATSGDRDLAIDMTLDTSVAIGVEGKQGSFAAA